MSASPHVALADLRVGEVHLVVADLARSSAFYTQSIGLRPLRRSNDCVAFGVDGRVLVVLHEQPGAVRPRGVTGLFHLALLVPARADLARWLAHAFADRVELTGLSDHGVSEAIYLNDPDGHGIEIYADAPRATWEGRVSRRLTVAPLDVAALDASRPALDDGWSGAIVPGTTVGHVHLRVSDLHSATAFYRDRVGLELTARLGPDAALLGVGGYHHHIGLNVWGSRGAPPPGPDVARLLSLRLILPDGRAVDDLASRLQAAGDPATRTSGTTVVQDPSGNAVELVAGIGVGSGDAT